MISVQIEFPILRPLNEAIDASVFSLCSVSFKHISYEFIRKSRFISSFLAVARLESHKSEAKAKVATAAECIQCSVVFHVIFYVCRCTRIQIRFNASTMMDYSSFVHGYEMEQTHTHTSDSKHSHSIDKSPNSNFICLFVFFHLVPSSRMRCLRCSCSLIQFKPIYVWRLPNSIHFQSRTFSFVSSPYRWPSSPPPTYMSMLPSCTIPFQYYRGLMMNVQFTQRRLMRVEFNPHLK